jgi:hypothetical protein
MTKTCISCNETKELHFFRKVKGCKLGVSVKCKACSSKKSKEQIDNAIKLKQLRETAKGQICTCCKLDKPFSEFHKDKRLKSGHNYVCKACLLEYRSKTKDKIKNRQLVYKYGITFSAYKEMCEEQNNKCLICKIIPDILYVDHCHLSGNIRGLLCQPCNTLLGMAKDKPDILHNAIQYLEQNNEKDSINILGSFCSSDS